MKKIFNIKSLPIVVFLVIMVFFCIYLIYKDKNKASTLSESQNITSQNISNNIKNEASKYEIDYSYPEFTGFKNLTTKQNINDDLKNIVLSAVDTFKGNANDYCSSENIPSDESLDWLENCHSYYSIDFSYTIFSNKILSVKIEDNSYFGNMAHGDPQFSIYNYDLSTGEKFNWEDVFIKSSNYLNLISEYSREDLKKQFSEQSDIVVDNDLINSGTDTTLDDEGFGNYTNHVGFSDNYLDIIFSVYQVGPYSFGQPEVKIPYNKLIDVINNDGLLGELK